MKRRFAHLAYLVPWLLAGAAGTAAGIAAAWWVGAPLALVLVVFWFIGTVVATLTFLGVVHLDFRRRDKNGPAPPQEDTRTMISRETTKRLHCSGERSPGKTPEKPGTLFDVQKNKRLIPHSARRS